MNSLGYLAMGNLIVNITRMSRDDLKISYTLKSKHCQMRENHPKKSENNNNYEIMSNRFSPMLTQ